MEGREWEQGEERVAEGGDGVVNEVGEWRLLHQRSAISSPRRGPAQSADSGDR